MSMQSEKIQCRLFFNNIMPLTALGLSLVIVLINTYSVTLKFLSERSLDY